MAEPIRVNASLSVPLDELRFAASRSSGPGGQHVNKTDTRVELRWRLADSRALTDAQRARLLDRLAGRINRDGELVMTCSTERSQRRNRDLVLARFAAVVRAALARQRPRRPTAPSPGSAQRRLDQKKRRSAVKRTRVRGGADED